MFYFEISDMIIKMSEGTGSTVIRRNLPGTKAANYSQWPEEPFDEMDSTLAVQQYIQQTIRKDPQGKIIGTYEKFSSQSECFLSQ